MRDQKILKYRQKYPDLDWSGSVYGGCAGLMTAVCGKHGEITKTGKHWNINGCPHCGRERAAVRNENRYSGFRAESNRHKEMFRAKWDALASSGRFNLDKAEFINSTTAVTVGCKDHGVLFSARPKNLVKPDYVGCPACRAPLPRGAKYYHEAVSRAWGGTYEYVSVPANRHDKVVAVCPHHGEFSVWLNNHLIGAGCPVCSNKQSKPETEVLEYIKSVYAGPVESRNRTVISPMELDIYLPGLRLAVEYNGLHWHADDSGATPLRHKWERCQDAGIRLVSIFEDEWAGKQEIVKSRLLSVLGKSKTVYARKCDVIDTDARIANEFHAAHHTGGKSGGTHFALVYDQRVVAALTMKNHGDKWEVMRYSSEGTVIGGFSKLFKHFLLKHGPKVVISYCDLRYGNGTVYLKNGFTLKHVTRPDYFWFKNHTRYNRHNFQKHKLSKSAEFARVYSPDKTERQMAEEMGYRRISGVGHQLWEYS